jgi:PilZ domain-containing protein
MSRNLVFVLHKFPHLFREFTGLTIPYCFLRVSPRDVRQGEAMRNSDVRSYTRTPKNLQVELVRTGVSSLQETAIAENVSARGARVATEKIWRPGDHVFLTTRETDIATQARVIYCQRLENGKYAVGLELVEAGRSEKQQ